MDELAKGDPARIRSSRRLVLAAIWLTGLTFGACGDSRRDARTAAAPVSVPDCRATSDRSSWLSPAAEFERIAQYGTLSGEELVDVWGVAATRAGAVLVWDAGSTRILRLSSGLEPLGTAGGEGEGPGEFVYQQSLHGNWITAGDSSFIVMGFSSSVLSEFTLDGRFLRNPTRAPPFPIPIARIELSGDDVLFGRDTVDGNGRRAMETWRLETDGPHTLLRSDPMGSLPLWRDRPVHRIPRQAEPLWALGASCVYLSDGSGHWLLRADLESGTHDTLRLPEVPIAEPTEQDREGWRRMWAQTIAMGAPPQIQRLEPTALARWAALAVDPDGHVWVEPWRPPSLRDEPLTALVVNPPAGTVEELRVPRFPSAFLPGGRFVALVEGPLGFGVELYGPRAR